MKAKVFVKKSLKKEEEIYKVRNTKKKFLIIESKMVLYLLEESHMWSPWQQSRVVAPIVNVSSNDNKKMGVQNYCAILVVDFRIKWIILQAFYI